MVSDPMHNLGLGPPGGEAMTQNKKLNIAVWGVVWYVLLGVALFGDGEARAACLIVWMFITGIFLITWTLCVWND
jgi:hypothetical protein